MSLNQLTANYTDSEGEEEENNRSVSISSEEHQASESKESTKGTPTSMESRGGSTTNTPKKIFGRLVSYANEDDDDEDRTFYNNEEIEESDEILNSEPMDTETEDGEEEKPSFKDLGVKLPAAPIGKCTPQLQEKVTHFVNRVKQGNMDWNRKIQNNKDFRNPSIYEKLIDHLGLDEMGSNYPLEMFDPHCWGKESYYDELSRVQKEEMDKREKERKEKTKVDIISGTKKPPEEELKKRKSRFDQAAPGNAVPVLKPSVPPPTLTAVPSGNKTTINAFGSLKKPK